MDTILEMHNITKTFPGVKALNNVNLNVRKGEIHALVGENGAGKSTLMKVLSGVYPHGSYEGEIHYNGQEQHFRDIGDSEAKGIIIIHQELALVPLLSIAENIFLGNEPAKFGIIDWHAAETRTRALLKKVGLREDPQTLITNLGVGKQQLVEIAKALSKEVELLILDEPTASLNEKDSDALLELLLEFKAQGISSILISHKLNEVGKVADRITVLRDGKLIATRNASELQPVDMAKLMVGRDMSKLYPEREETATHETILEVSNFDVPGYAREASFTLRKGEILGFAGLIGAGRTELFEGIVGLRSGHGQVKLNGKPVRFHSVRDSMAAGIVYLSEDRKGKGLLLAQNLRTNLTLASLEKFTKGPLIERKQEEQGLDKAIAEFDIRARRRDLLAGQLSGGNQQKLLLAKMMLLDPSIVIIDEPTRGIDIGTKEQIYRFIADLAKSGKSVIVISSEMQELIGICHRILVMRSARIVGEVSGDAMTEDEIVVYATGVKTNEAELYATGSA